MFILASSVCKSLQYLISALTQGVEGGHLFRLTCSVVLWGGRNTANKYHWCVWGVLAVYGPHWVCPSSWSMCFPGLHVQAPGSPAGVLSKSGSVFHELPRSKLLRFGFLGTPQRHRLGWAYTSCPSQVQAAQETRCLASGLTQVGRASYSTTQSLPLSFLGVP